MMWAGDSSGGNVAATDNGLSSNDVTRKHRWQRCLAAAA